MHRLTHFTLCPFSRSIRLALAECQLSFTLAEERPWEWPKSLLALNPAGELPVLQLEGGAVVCGAYAISEFLSEGQSAQATGRPVAGLFPAGREARAEVRRLIDWFHRKFDREVTRELLFERVYPCLSGGPIEPPDTEVLRAVQANLRYHASYVDHLVAERHWLAGDELTFADLAAAAHLSTADYLGEVPWENYAAAKAWYARMKSRPSFRPLLGDRVAALRPPPHYADLDF
ncbi:MAG TPA: glutathione S-transferase family protein [Hyphomicrobiaceae bacterium]|nr:glutathione S-transferase family protein [Hyphomicrobiaceae bacterium]